MTFSTSRGGLPRLTDEQYAIIRQVDRIMGGDDWEHARDLQAAAYLDRLSLVLDADDEIVIASTLRPADACNVRQAQCYCWLPKGHAAVAHHCACGGEWIRNGLGQEITPVRWPGPFSKLPVTT